MKVPPFESSYPREPFAYGIGPSPGIVRVPRIWIPLRESALRVFVEKSRAEKCVCFVVLMHRVYATHGPYLRHARPTYFRTVGLYFGG